MNLNNLYDSLMEYESIFDIDYESIIDNFEDSEDYEHNIKSLKLKRKELEKLSNTYNIDCFTINITPLKEQFEQHIAKINN